MPSATLPLRSDLLFMDQLDPLCPPPAANAAASDCLDSLLAQDTLLLASLSAYPSIWPSSQADPPLVTVTDSFGLTPCLDPPPFGEWIPVPSTLDSLAGTFHLPASTASGSNTTTMPLWTPWTPLANPPVLPPFSQIDTMQDLRLSPLPLPLLPDLASFDLNYNNTIAPPPAQLLSPMSVYALSSPAPPPALPFFDNADLGNSSTTYSVQAIASPVASLAPSSQCTSPDSTHASDHDDSVYIHTPTLIQQEPRTRSTPAAVAKPKRRYNPINNYTRSRHFPCTLCTKVYTRKYNLDAHMHTHTNMKPYVCMHDGCTKSFARKNDLYRHETTVHERRVYGTCSTCNLSFVRGDAYNRHIRLDSRCRGDSSSEEDLRS